MIELIVWEDVGKYITRHNLPNQCYQKEEDLKVVIKRIVVEELDSFNEVGWAQFDRLFEEMDYELFV